MVGRKEKSQRYAHILRVGNEEANGAINKKFMAEGESMLWGEVGGVADFL